MDKFFSTKFEDRITVTFLYLRNSLKMILICCLPFVIFNGGLIDWCLMPTLTVFQLFCGVNKCDKTPTRSFNTKHASL